MLLLSSSLTQVTEKRETLLSIAIIGTHSEIKRKMPLFLNQYNDLSKEMIMIIFSLQGKELFSLYTLMYYLSINTDD